MARRLVSSSKPPSSGAYIAREKAVREKARQIPKWVRTRRRIPSFAVNDIDKVWEVGEFARRSLLGMHSRREAAG
jgi:hypothetical protein